MQEGNLIERMEAYLDGSLSEAERHELLLLLRDNPAIKEQFAQMRHARQAEEASVAESVRIKVQQLIQQGDPPMPPEKRPFPWFLAGTLAVFFVGAAIYIWQKPVEVLATPFPAIPPNAPVQTIPDTPASPSAMPGNKNGNDPKPAPVSSNVPPPFAHTPTHIPEKHDLASRAEELALLAYNEESSPTFPTLRGADDVLQQASKHLNKKEYASAAALLRILPSTPQAGRNDALRIRAHSYFHLRRYAESAADFSELSKSSPAEQDANEWYTLLAFAAQGDTQKAAFLNQWGKITGFQRHKYLKKANDLKARLGW